MAGGDPTQEGEGGWLHPSCTMGSSSASGGMVTPAPVSV